MPQTHQDADGGVTDKCLDAADGLLEKKRGFRCWPVLRGNPKERIAAPVPLRDLANAAALGANIIYAHCEKKIYAGARVENKTWEQFPKAACRVRLVPEQVTGTVGRRLAPL
jgi:hypothetical protein